MTRVYRCKMRKPDGGIVDGCGRELIARDDLQAEVLQGGECPGCGKGFLRAVGIGVDFAYTVPSKPVARVYRSRNGSRIPNPYVDNARPHPSLRTWATVGGRPCKVIVMPSPIHNGYRAPIHFVAHVQGHPVYEGHGVGPSEAISRLDKLLFQGF